MSDQLIILILKKSLSDSVLERTYKKQQKSKKTTTTTATTTSKLIVCRRGFRNCSHCNDIKMTPQVEGRSNYLFNGVYVSSVLTLIAPLPPAFKLWFAGDVGDRS